MVSVWYARKAALAFEEAVEQPHFERTSFRVNKKIFATMDKSKKQVVVKFSPEEQSLFGIHDPSAIYPVPGGWGKQGYTIIELAKVRKVVFNDALRISYCHSAPKKLAEKYRL
ncbi:MAG: MmcQ/YjbR family DNA-binding protein [Chitinophagales bacterium]|nr:MmcQ/YjbR family DNA-binding protein [Chitinophagales bacterium]